MLVAVYVGRLFLVRHAEQEVKNSVHCPIAPRHEAGLRNISLMSFDLNVSISDMNHLFSLDTSRYDSHSEGLKRVFPFSAAAQQSSRVASFRSKMLPVTFFYLLE